MARGHRISEVKELPLVVSEGAEGIQKTKQAVDLLEKLGCKEELKKVTDSKKIHAGKGKYRNRRYSLRKGPLVVYNEDNGISRALRNIPGVESCSIDRINLLDVAPGGTFGRFIIWTEGAFKKLGEMYGSYRCKAPLKKDYRLMRASMENADVARIINSDEVQSVLRPKLEAPKRFAVKKNPLKNPMVMARLNPGVLQRRLQRKRAHQAGTAEHTLVQKKAKANLAESRKHHKGSKQFYGKLMKAFETKMQQAEAEADE